MPDEKDKKNKSIVSSGQQSITKYSSDLIRRGLDSIAKIEQKDKIIIPYRRKITLENARQVKQVAQLELDIEKDRYRYRDWGSIKFVKFSSDGNLFAVISTKGVWLCEANKLNMTQEIETGINRETKDHKLTSGPVEKFAHLWRVKSKFPFYEEIIPAEEDYLEEIENDLELSLSEEEEFAKIKFIRFEKKEDDFLFLRAIKGYGFPGMFNIRGKPRSCFALSPDCTILAVGDEDGNMRLINMPDGFLLYERELGDPIKSLTFSPDGNILVCQFKCNRSYRLFFLRTADFSPRCDKLPLWCDRILECPYSFHNIIFSPDGTILAWYHWGKIYLYPISNLISNQSLLGTLSINVNESIRTLAFSPDGTLLACNCHSGNTYLLALYDSCRSYGIEKVEEIIKENIDNRGRLLSPGGKILTFDADYITEYINLYGDVAFSSDGSILASSNRTRFYFHGCPDSDGYTIFYEYSFIHLWDVSRVSLLHELETPNVIRGLTFSPDDTVLASPSISKIQFWGL